MAELSQPERIIKIKQDFENRLARHSCKKTRNALQEGLDEFLDIDDIYGDEEGNGGCSICTK